MKRYYSDDGMLQFDLNDDLMDKFQDAIPVVPSNKKARLVQRAELMEVFEEIGYSYQIHGAVGGDLGGCLTTEQWKEQPEDSTLKDVIKEMLYDFVERGFLHNEFPLVGRAAISVLQFNNM